MSLSLAPDPVPILGSITPRLFTPPAVSGAPGPCGCGCALTEDTSYGFDVVRFAADTLGVPLDPWQRWLVIHAGELLAGGSPRFRRVLVLVARQNGKTMGLVVLTLYWMFVEQQLMILGTSTKLAYAKEPWEKAHKLALQVPELSAEIPYGKTRGMRKAAGQEEWRTTSREVDGTPREVSRYVVSASNEEGGRSLTLNRAVCDELRQHHDYSAYNASYYAMNAVPDAQWFALSNAGDDRSVVLNDLREMSGVVDDRMTERVQARDLGLFEWSAPRGSDPEDQRALAMANPNVGRRLLWTVLLEGARAAKAKGGAVLAGFLTESMCIRVASADPAVDMAAWERGRLAGTLEAVRSRVALCFDVATSMQHATLYAASVIPGGKVRVEFVKEWIGTGCADRAARELPALVRKIRPKTFGWLPSGPAAATAAAIADRALPNQVRVWPPHGVTVEEIRGEVSAVCMGFAETVDAGQVVHAGDPLLDAQLAGAERLIRGDTWVFSRRNEGDCDAAYGAAGAAHLARTMPASIGKPRLVVLDD